MNIPWKTIIWGLLALAALIVLAVLKLTGTDAPGLEATLATIIAAALGALGIVQAARSPGSGDKGFSVLGVVVILGLIALMALAAGCGAQRCADGDNIIATMKRAPGVISARCAGDPEAQERIRLEGRELKLRAVCPPGQELAGEDPQLKPCGRAEPCTTALISCRPVAP